MERSGRVKGTRGKGLCVKKGLRAGKFENWRRRPVQPVSAMMGGAEIELRALVGMGVARADSTGAGGETSKSESTSNGLKEAKRDGVIGGGSRRRLCCVCGLRMLAGREKIEGGTDMVTRG
jgi:hypothetical protein